MRPLTELAANQCRYPVSDECESQVALCSELPFARHLFCGQATSGGPYCEAHEALCRHGPGIAWEKLYEWVEAHRDDPEFTEWSS